MQTLSDELKAHLEQEVTTLARCWSIARTDGVVLRFTDHDRDIVIGGDVYKAADGMTPTGVSSQSGLAVDNSEFEGILSAAAITEDDVLSGRYDHAQINLFMVNYNAPTAGRLQLKSGWLGEVTLQGSQFTAELRGISARLQQTIGEVYTSACRADLGDTRCGINLASYTFSGTVTAVEGSYAFSDTGIAQANDFFSGGIVHFTSGANEGLRMEVRDFSNHRFALFLPLPGPIAVGDTYIVSAGCDKQFDTCVRKFNNALHFRGEPHVPGTDKLLETSATRSL